MAQAGKTGAQISIIDLLIRQRAYLVLFAVALTVVSAGISGSIFLEMRGFEARAVATTGEVLDRNIATRRRRSTDGTRGTERRYQVTYSFEPGDGEVVEGRQNVSQRFYDDLNAGESVRVRYLPDDPQASRLQNREMTGVMIWGGLALVPAAISLWFGLRFWRRTAAMLRAGRLGERRSATVIEHVGSKVKMGEDPISWHVHWRDHTGAEGESLGHDGFELYTAAPKGREIQLCVDPVTRQAFWERDIFAR